ncbi:NUDIX hydrolase [Limoniibacter endophyticus]|uniref:Nudix hydrolase domain-containing protein n=1 Tax=Limoniibacter endophyticus TaxID=1565040 RepID=A0A8J3DQT3_9HYPH|nr:NUDIX domain-containing protein [Limoniibacter endophyticus]GHC78028.1 hypothetical protein GCM10010136_29650 [Limoniibacter endophyticus]
MPNPYSTPSFINEAFREWYVYSGTQCLGYVPFSISAFLVRQGLLVENGTRLELSGKHETAQNLSCRLEDVRDALCREGLIVPHRCEAMDVCYSSTSSPIAKVDRSALRILGLWATKVHVNGFVKDLSSGRAYIWLSQRSDAANAAPGHWDTLVAGGKASGVSMLQTAIKEGWEEAGIAEEHMRRLAPRGRIPVVYFSKQGMHRELLVSYDLSLPADFKPECHDGEVQDFLRIEATRLRMESDPALPIKFSSRMVLDHHLNGNARRQEQLSQDNLTSLPASQIS